jgi:hypothetical protein
MALVPTAANPRATRRLLRDCGLFGVGKRRASARRRLEAKVGKEFAGLLLVAVLGDQVRRRRGRVMP